MRRKKLFTNMKRAAVKGLLYSETLNKSYIERIHQMLYSSLSDNGMLQIFSFFFKLSSLKLFMHIHGHLFIFENTGIYEK